MYKILHYPDPRLNIKAETVTDFNDPVFQEMVERMLETLASTEDCGGLAATQLDISNPKRITVIDWKGQLMELVNPEVIARSGDMLEPEACMSVCPGYVADRVKRAKKVTVQAYDRHGKQLTLEGEDYYAKLLQHEIDHLNGVIYLDHLSRIKRTRLEAKITRVKKYLVQQQKKEQKGD